MGNNMQLASHVSRLSSCNAHGCNLHHSEHTGMLWFECCRHSSLECFRSPCAYPLLVHAACWMFVLHGNSICTGQVTDAGACNVR